MNYKIAVLLLAGFLCSCGGGGDAGYPTIGASPSSPDLEAPILQISSQVTDESGATNQRVSVTGATDNIAVAAYCLSSSPYRPSPQDSCFTTSREWVAPIGPIFYVWAKDSAGNISLPITPQICEASAIEASKASNLPNVCMHTDFGDLVIELERAKAPVSVSNFLSYVSDSFYQGTVFHRIIKGVVVQGGGYEVVGGNRKGKDASLMKPAIALEKTTQTGLSNTYMTIAMARTSDPNSATSQFYFNMTDNSKSFDSSASQDGYAVFGKVIYGQSVIEAIQNVSVTASQSGEQSSPVQDIYVRWAYVMK